MFLRRLTATIALGLTLLAATAPAVLAQTTTPPTNPHTITWQDLSAPNDWAAGVIRELFPINPSGNPPTGSTPTSSLGLKNEHSVFGTVIGVLNAIVVLISGAWFAYATLMEVHRGAETGQILNERTSGWFAPRIAMAALLMVPVGGGFNAGQAALVQIANWAVGGADLAYDYGMTALGPGGLPIVSPQVPNTQAIVAGLIQDEACMDIVNDLTGAGKNGYVPVIPTPAPLTTASTYGAGARVGAGFTSFVQNIPIFGGMLSDLIPNSIRTGAGATITYAYNMTGNSAGSVPLCGSVSVQLPAPDNAAGLGNAVNLGQAQQAALNNVLVQTIRPGVGAAITAFVLDRNSNDLSTLMQTFSTATAAYDKDLATAAASFVKAEGQTKVQQDNLAQMQALGWSGAGAYFMDIAAINGHNLSALENTAAVNQPAWPDYPGLPAETRQDITPFMVPLQGFLTQMQMYVNVAQGSTPPHVLSAPNPSMTGIGAADYAFNAIGLNQMRENALVTAILPSTQSQWTDPFLTMTNLGQNMTLMGLGAIGTDALLRSNLGTAAVAAGEASTGNEVGAGATIAAKALGLLGGPMGMLIFAGCTALLFQGLWLAYVIPMVPLAMWIAGVMNWLILVCEAIIAVPIFLLAHLTYRGDGFHGANTRYGYGMLVNILVRPIVMFIGLLLAYFIFSAAAWLTFNLFGIAATFVFNNGSVVTNLFGLIVVVGVEVLLLTVEAVIAFRMISVVTNVMRWGQMEPENRLDPSNFADDAMLRGGQNLVKWTGNLPGQIGQSFSPGSYRLGYGGGGGGGGNSPMAQGGGNPYNGGGNPGQGSGGGAAATPDSAINAATTIVPPAE